MAKYDNTSRARWAGVIHKLSTPEKGVNKYKSRCMPSRREERSVCGGGRGSSLRCSRRSSFSAGRPRTAFSLIENSNRPSEILFRDSASPTFQRLSVRWGDTPPKKNPWRWYCSKAQRESYQEMVMEAPPCPQYVGREFVRQYYTLLNQAPEHLHSQRWYIIYYHPDLTIFKIASDSTELPETLAYSDSEIIAKVRTHVKKKLNKSRMPTSFYNNNSSFVHGGLDASNRETKHVVGQKQIHQKIQQLNFMDCHAKISKVDSQATLGDGVVVQVTGELSNSGEPMRRFTQTFVLAAQSPLKYYVHNDIFRYQPCSVEIVFQDMIFSDEECEQDSGRSEPEEELEPERSPSLDNMPSNQHLSGPPPQQTMTAYYNNANAVVSSAVVPPTLITQPLAPPHQMNGSVHLEEVMAPTVVVVPLPQPQPTLPHTMQTLSSQQQPPPMSSLPTSHLVAPVHAPVVIQDESEDDQELGPNEEVGEVETLENLELEENMESKHESQDETHLEPVSNEPKTYATLLKSGGIGGVGTPLFASNISSSPQLPAKPTTSPPPVSRTYEPRIMDSGSTSGLPGSMGPAGMQGQRGARGGRGGAAVRGMMRNDRVGPGRGSFNEDSGPMLGADGDRRRSGVNMTQQYSDNQQLFLGNLPHAATEDDLKQLFSKFGAVIDLRIHSKTNNKGMNGNRVPNYGFITFEEPSTVQAVLSSRVSQGLPHRCTVQAVLSSQVSRELPHRCTVEAVLSSQELLHRCTGQAVLSSRVSWGLPHRCTGQAVLSSQVSQELLHRCTGQAVLSSQPIFYPDQNGQKLNVEEKKNRPRQSMDGGRMGSGGDNMMGGGRSNPGMGPRPGVGGPGGMMRGMPHRGGGRGGFARGDGRGGGLNRGSGNYQRR
uniref:Uncharacterized protein n=1 Tax=Timema shepardi TaxID=629360 RepID=A0A7R9G1Y7_TIMSH|nr:unnamed protein product [Timema shepardi]